MSYGKKQGKLGAERARREQKRAQRQRLCLVLLAVIAFGLILGLFFKSPESESPATPPANTTLTSAANPLDLPSHLASAEGWARTPGLELLDQRVELLLESYATSATKRFLADYRAGLVTWGYRPEIGRGMLAAFGLDTLKTDSGKKIDMPHLMINPSMILDGSPTEMATMSILLDHECEHYVEFLEKPHWREHYRVGQTKPPCEFIWAGEIRANTAMCRRAQEKGLDTAGLGNCEAFLKGDREFRQEIFRIYARNLDCEEEWQQYLSGPP